MAHTTTIMSSGARFVQIGRKMITVRDPRPIELQGLVSMSRIKPWTDPVVRSYLEADMRAARDSLKHV